MDSTACVSKVLLVRTVQASTYVQEWSVQRIPNVLAVGTSMSVSVSVDMRVHHHAIKQMKIQVCILITEHPLTFLVMQLFMMSTLNVPLGLYKIQ